MFHGMSEEVFLANMLEAESSMKSSAICVASALLAFLMVIVIV